VYLSTRNICNRALQECDTRFLLHSLVLSLQKGLEKGLESSLVNSVVKITGDKCGLVGPSVFFSPG
jgi:hypothetical protein